MNYYIQGSPTRAEQIKAAFQELGINVLDFGFADKTVVYCSIGECVQYLPYSINLMNILYSHPDYQELELTTKSKFKVGNWLYPNCNGIYPVLVTDYDKCCGYQLQEGSDRCHLSRKIVEDEYHLWSIADAKDGDVLVVNGSSKQYKWIGIFKVHTSDTSFSSHCHYNCGMCEFVTHIARCTKHGTGKYSDIRPATNEERDLLFAKMKEAGYEWDADKKELRKIKPHYDYQEIELPTKPKPNFKVCDWIVRSNGSSDIPIQVYGLKKDRYLVTNMLGSKGEVMLTCQDEWHLWTIEDAIDGDVLSFDNETIVVFKDMYNATSFHSHCHLEDGIFDISTDDMPDWWRADGFKPATKEQCDLLFHKMKEAGYQWDEKKKELKKIPSHYDISNFNAGMPVLVRADNNCRWDYSVFSRITGNEDWQFAVCNGVNVAQCIPFYGNEKLLGTTNMCPEEYINW